MGRIGDELWKYNLVRVTLVDVTEDYRTLLMPLPSRFYPVLSDVWLPTYKLTERLLKQPFVPGYCYDWHEISLTAGAEEHWFVGVVSERLL